MLGKLFITTKIGR